MATISINTIESFDAIQNYKITFAYSGNQCTGNTIKVYNSANAVVFDETTASLALNHVIPAGTLVNGNTYYVVITAYYQESGVQ